MFRTPVDGYEFALDVGRRENQEGNQDFGLTAGLHCCSMLAFDPAGACNTLPLARSVSLRFQFLAHPALRFPRLPKAVHQATETKYLGAVQVAAKWFVKADGRGHSQSLDRNPPSAQTPDGIAKTELSSVTTCVYPLDHGPPCTVPRFLPCRHWLREWMPFRDADRRRSCPDGKL